MSSRLFQEIREKRGLCYSIFSFIETLSDTGSIVIYSGTGRDQVSELSNVVADELKKLSKSIKNRLGIGGSIKNNEVYFQGNKRDQIISILKSQGHTVKRIGG